MEEDHAREAIEELRRLLLAVTRLLAVPALLRDGAAAAGPLVAALLGALIQKRAELPRLGIPFSCLGADLHMQMFAAAAGEASIAAARPELPLEELRQAASAWQALLPTDQDHGWATLVPRLQELRARLDAAQV